MSGDTGADSDPTRRGQQSDDSTGTRSILVLGDGLVAAATAGFLEQAGLDTVLSGATAPSLQTTVRMLWEPGLTLLERIGLRRPIERTGYPVRALQSLPSKTRWTASGDTTGYLVAVEGGRLQSLIERRLLDRLTMSEQVVTSMESVDAGVRATFGGTTTELFDVAITTTRSGLPDQRGVLTARSVETWAVTARECDPDSDRLTEGWAPNKAAFSTPISGGRAVRLVSVADTPSHDALCPESLARRFDDLVPGAPFDTIDQRDLQYRRIPSAIPRRSPSDRVVPVGTGARFSIPGDCLGTTLGIEDAWVVADTLAYGSPDIESAVTEYVDRRRRRVTDLRSLLPTHATPDDDRTTLTPLVRQLRGRRRLAFRHIIDRSLPAVARTVPEAL